MSTTDQENIEVGKVFDGRFSIERLLGSGGMGEVYLARDQFLSNELVALKVLRPELSKDERLKKRFLREVQLTRKVTHPNVVRTFDVGECGPHLYFTMEYAPGETLEHHIEQGPIPPLEVANILLQIGDGLHAIHSLDIIHRDLKPGNVIVTPDGVAKITDFGVARPGVSDFTTPDECIGSAPYMSPEIWTGQEISTQSDIYALGALAYELLTSIWPFDGETSAELMYKHLQVSPVLPSHVTPGVPEWFDDLILWMMRKQPSERPRSVIEVLRVIEASLRPPTETVPPEVPLPPPADPLVSQVAMFTMNPPTLDEELIDQARSQFDALELEKKPGFFGKLLRTLTDSRIRDIGLRSILRGNASAIGAAGITFLLLGPASAAAARVHSKDWLGQMVAGGLAVWILCLVVAIPLVVVAAYRASISESLQVWFRAAFGLSLVTFGLFTVLLIRGHLLGGSPMSLPRSKVVTGAWNTTIQSITEAGLFVPWGTTLTPAMAAEMPSIVRLLGGSTASSLIYLAFFTCVVGVLVRAFGLGVVGCHLSRIDRFVWIWTPVLVIFSVLLSGLADSLLEGEIRTLLLTSTELPVAGYSIHFSRLELVLGYIPWFVAGLVAFVVHLRREKKVSENDPFTLHHT